MEENLTLVPIEDLPATDEPKRKQRPKVNCLQDMLLEIMNERRLTDAQIVKATGIPWGTYMGWRDGAVHAQLADGNLLKLATYLNVDLYYLLYGIGSDEPRFKDEEDEK